MIQYLVCQIQPESFVFFHVLDKVAAFPGFQAQGLENQCHHLAADFIVVHFLREIKGNEIGRNHAFGNQDVSRLELRGCLGPIHISSASTEWRLISVSMRKGEVWNAQASSLITGFCSVQ